jgi:hypothetical protein
MTSSERRKLMEVIIFDGDLLLILEALLLHPDRDHAQGLIRRLTVKVETI